MKFTTFILFTCILSLFGPVNLLADTGSNSGTVAETIDAGGYTYLRIKESDTWIATSTLEVSSGAQIEYSGGSEMYDFYSKSLDRTFESIWFVGNVRVSGQGAQGHPSMHDTIPKSTAIASPAPGEIEKLEGGKTIEEILSDTAILNTKAVSLRARVTKVNADIMGRNWITLQDGTGTAPGNKLIATSQEMVTLGEIVTANGVINNDVDLGYGYHYVALLEDATFEK
jgi:hypothetical protein